MYLLIDANEGRLAQVASANDKPDWQVYPRETSLPEIAPDPQEIEGIVVWQGKGSFSLSREAVVYANMLAMAKNIPLLSVEDDKLPPLAGLLTELHANHKKELHPVYSGEPNITKKA